MSQTAFAALAGATKSTQIKWENGASSSPNAPAMAAFADAGADVIYILTGRRSNVRPDNATTQIEDDLAEYRRNLADPARHAMPGEDRQQVEERTIEMTANGLQAILRYDRSFLDADKIEEVQHLLDIAQNPAGLSLYRAAEVTQNRKKREDIRRQLASWTDGLPYVPGDAVTYLLTALAMEYSVPVKFIAEIVEQVAFDIEGRKGSQ